MTTAANQPAPAHPAPAETAPAGTRVSAFRAETATWPSFYRKPVSLHEAWERTGFASNRAARIALFALAAVAPAPLAGPVLSLGKALAAARPAPAPDAEPEADAEPDVETDAETKTKTPGRARRYLTTCRDRITGWPGFHRTPPTRQQAWQASDVNATRVPAESQLLTGLWFISNLTDRIALFGLAHILPAILVGPAYWTAKSPARRCGAFVVLLTILVLVPQAVS